MSLDLLRRRSLPLLFELPQVSRRLAALICFGLLGTACALASLLFACAAPFAAFAVVAAAMLPLPSAIIAVGGVWLINQAIGFGLLSYPLDASTIAWGGVILVAALAGTAAASSVLQHARGNRTIALAIAFVAAFAAYELALLAVTPVLGGHEAMAPAIVARIAGLNLIWLLGSLAAVEILRLLAGLRVRGSVTAGRSL
jgi:hypothetical protein